MQIFVSNGWTDLTVEGDRIQAESSSELVRIYNGDDLVCVVTPHIVVVQEPVLKGLSDEED